MQRPIDVDRIQRIWVRAPNWVGDFVMATATFRRLRRAFPKAHIAGGMRPFLAPLASGSDFFDEVVATPRGGGLSGLWRQVRSLRRGRFDLAVVLPNSPAAGLPPFLGGVRWRLGYKQGRPLLMNVGLTAPVRRHWWQRRDGPRRWPSPMPTYYHDLLDCLGIPAGGTHPELAVTAEDDSWVEAHLRTLGVAPGEPLLLLVVGANFGSSKLWVPERFGAVARHFQLRHRMRALVLVGPAEVELGERIAQDGAAICLSQPVLPLDRLKALIRRGALMITGDTGPRHIANAFDVPVVCLIGPSDPAYTDYCMERTVLLRKDLECSPCQRKVCPLGHQRCMRDITVDEVVAAGERLLQLAPRERDDRLD